MKLIYELWGLDCRRLGLEFDWNGCNESIFLMTGPKPLLSVFGIHHRLDRVVKYLVSEIPESPSDLPPNPDLEPDP